MHARPVLCISGTTNTSRESSLNYSTGSIAMVILSYTTTAAISDMKSIHVGATGMSSPPVVKDDVSSVQEISTLSSFLKGRTKCLLCFGFVQSAPTYPTHLGDTYLPYLLCSAPPPNSTSSSTFLDEKASRKSYIFLLPQNFLGMHMHDREIRTS